MADRTIPPPTMEETRLRQLHQTGSPILKRPTKYKPGSEDKVSLMAARYAEGLPLFVKGDGYAA